MGGGVQPLCRPGAWAGWSEPHLHLCNVLPSCCICVASAEQLLLFLDLLGMGTAEVGGRGADSWGGQTDPLMLPFLSSGKLHGLGGVPPKVGSGHLYLWGPGVSQSSLRVPLGTRTVISFFVAFRSGDGGYGSLWPLRPMVEDAVRGLGDPQEGQRALWSLDILFPTALPCAERKIKRCE